MNPLPPPPRYERKFVIDGVALAEVLALVRRHPAAFRETYPARWVNNLYLDSPDLGDYRDHVNGLAARSKTRLRWYGDWSGHTATRTLERKLKRGLISGKITYALPPALMNGGWSRGGLKAVFAHANLPPLVLSALCHLQPALLNRYQRRYFLSADHRFRLTVDSHLQFAPPRPASGTRAAFVPPTSGLVVELKFALAEADAATGITNALPFRLARCSKYVLGINRLG